MSLQKRFEEHPFSSFRFRFLGFCFYWICGVVQTTEDTGTEAEQLLLCRKTYFNHFHLQVAVSLAYKYFTSLSNRERTHLCAPENCCSFDENSHFTSQNKGAAGLPLPQMVS